LLAAFLNWLSLLEQNAYCLKISSSAGEYGAFPISVKSLPATAAERGAEYAC